MNSEISDDVIAIVIALHVFNKQGDLAWVITRRPGRYVGVEYE